MGALPPGTVFPRQGQDFLRILHAVPGEDLFPLLLDGGSLPLEPDILDQQNDPPHEQQRRAQEGKGGQQYPCGSRCKGSGQQQKPRRKGSPGGRLLQIHLVGVQIGFVPCLLGRHPRKEGVGGLLPGLIGGLDGRLIVPLSLLELLLHIAQQVELLLGPAQDLPIGGHSVPAQFRAVLLLLGTGLREL